MRLICMVEYDVRLLCEGYGRTHKASYAGWQNDPKPYILILGRWRNPNTGNNLVGGINLNYLSDAEIEHLQKVLQRILGGSKDLRGRYWRGRSLLPSVFNRAYRTYRQDLINAVTPGTLRYLKPDGSEPEPEKKKLAQVAPMEPVDDALPEL